MQGPLFGLACSGEFYKLVITWHGRLQGQIQKLCPGPSRQPTWESRVTCVLCLFTSVREGQGPTER